MDLLKKLGVTGYTLETSIKVGSLWIRSSEIQRHLARYAQRFVNSTGDETYQFQHLGTAAGIKYRGRYFVVTTEHQRKLGTSGQLGIFCDPGQSVVTPSRNWIITPGDNQEREDNLDFSIYEFEPSKYPHRTLTTQFFEVGQSSGITDEIGTMIFALGYPTRLQNVDYYEGKVDLLVVSSVVQLVEQTTTEHVYTFRTLSEDRFLEEGMSGSPVFEIVRESGKFGVRWLGIVVRGGTGSRFGRVISADFILQQIDAAAFSE